MLNIWLDGVCKKYGSLVIEQSSDKMYFDYMNACLNLECEEHKWYYVGDQDILNYYEHDPKIYKRITIRKKYKKGNIVTLNAHSGRIPFINMWACLNCNDLIDKEQTQCECGQKFKWIKNTK